MKSKVALISGVLGQDGSYLAELLLSKGYEVHGIMRRVAVPNMKFVKGLNITLHEGDLSDPGSIYRIIDKVRPDEFYNFACMAGVAPSFNQFEYTFDTGATAVVRIIEAIRQIDPKIKFFQACSSHIFGDTPVVPQNENTPMQPISPYGLAKASSRMALHMYRRAYGMFVCSAIFYAHASPRYSESFLLSKVVHSIWRIMRGEQEYLEVGNLDVPTDVGYAKDFVEAAYNIMQQEKPDDFVICTGETHTPREFIEIAFKEAGLSLDKLKINENLKRPSEVSLLVGDFSKANKAFGYKPRISYEELVKLMVHEISSQ